MSHLLVLILTSSQIRLCVRAYNSLQDQLPHGLQVTTKVVVNSLQPGYAAGIQAALPDVDVIETVSTGLPGVGHNSCLDYFRDHPEYDYLFHLDGDDLVYSTCLCALEMLTECQPTFVGSVGLDRLVNTPNLHSDGQPLGYGLWRTSAKTDNDPGVWQKYPPSNPFSTLLEDTFTPSRPLLFGRAVFELPVPIRWSTELVKHDDFQVFLAAMENIMRHGAEDIYFCPTTQVYVYNIMNLGSSTKTKHVDFKKQQSIFIRDTAEIRFLKKHWDTTFKEPVPTLILPHIPAPPNHKTVHLQKHVVDFALQKYKIAEDHFQEKRYRLAIQWFTKVYEEGVYSGALFLRLGICYAQKGNSIAARSCFEIAAKLPKTQELGRQYLSDLDNASKVDSVPNVDSVPDPLPFTGVFQSHPNDPDLTIKSVQMVHKYQPLTLSASADSETYLDICMQYI